MTNKLHKKKSDSSVLLKIAEAFNSVAECNLWVSKITGVSKTTASIWRVRNTKRPIPRLKLKELVDAIKSEFPQIKL